MRRVLVVAPSAAARAGLEGLLARSGDFAVLGSASDVGLAATVEETEPEVVVVAIESPGALPLPLGLPPDLVPRSPAIVVVGPEPLRRWAPRALRLGARAVLPRTATAVELAAAVEAAAAGLVAAPAELAGEVPARGDPRLDGSAAAPALTPRELEVLTLLAAGRVNKEIAAALGISEHTVKTHLGSIYAKLGVSSRAEAVARGVRAGVLML